jgi:hypothetical protein
VALGEQKGYVEFSYPKRDTWFGSVDPKVIKKLALSQDVITEFVEQKTIDDYFSQIGQKRTLIKIDTEGNELAVLRGANRTLQENKPKIIFESWNDTRRIEIFDFLHSKKYILFHLPWNPADNAQPLSYQQFVKSSSINFMAIPT